MDARQCLRRGRVMVSLCEENAEQRILLEFILHIVPSIIRRSAPPSSRRRLDLNALRAIIKMRRSRILLALFWRKASGGRSPVPPKGRMMVPLCEKNAKQSPAPHLYLANKFYANASRGKRGKVLLPISINVQFSSLLPPNSSGYKEKRLLLIKKFYSAK